MHKEIFEDLLNAGHEAKKALKENFTHRHVVYAYSEKANPDSIVVLDWYQMQIFTSDEAFQIWLDSVKADIDMIYAVHAI